MSNIELTGIILAIAGIIISVLLALKYSNSRKRQQTQKTDGGSISIQSGRDTKLK